MKQTREEWKERFFKELENTTQTIAKQEINMKHKLYLSMDTKHNWKLSIPKDITGTEIRKRLGPNTCMSMNSCGKHRSLYDVWNVPVLNIGSICPKI